MSIGKKVTVLTMVDYEQPDTEVLGVYSSGEAAKIQAQIECNNVTDEYGDPRTTLRWETHPTTGSASAGISEEIEFRIDIITLDADIVIRG